MKCLGLTSTVLLLASLIGQPANAELLFDRGLPSAPPITIQNVKGEAMFGGQQVTIISGITAMTLSFVKLAKARSSIIFEHGRCLAIVVTYLTNLINWAIGLAA